MENKDAEWSKEVKIKAHWMCLYCSQGVFDKAILESHHKKPKEQFPESRHDPDNGECDCLWRHALTHKDNPAAMNMILLRLVKLLTKRLYGGQLSECQKYLLEAEIERMAV